VEKYLLAVRSFAEFPGQVLAGEMQAFVDA
jgi:hypothetical protein